MSIGIYGPTVSTGTFNVLGTENGAFIIQGNLTIEQIKELRDECNAVLKSHKETK